MTLRFSEGLRDKLNGINTELVTDGTMSTDAAVQAAWTEVTATMLGGVSFDSATTMSLDTAAGYASQSVTVNPGHWYKFSFKWGSSGGTDATTVKLGTAADDATYYSFTDSSAQATLATVGAGATVSDTIMFKTGAAVTSVVITLGVGGTTDIAYFDDVSLIEQAHSIQDIFNLGQIEIRTGTQPSSSNAAPTGTLLVTILSGANGITFDDSSGAIVTKAAAETWSGVCGATGSAGWARLLLAGDGDALSTTDPRMDMAISTSGSQLNFSSTSFTSGATQTITSWALTLPEA